MRAMWIIAKKELKSYLYSPIAYILTAFFLLVAGFFFYNITVMVYDRILMAMQQQQMMERLDITPLIYGNFFSNLSIILMFLTPLLTMRLFSEEKRMRTEEMLLTSPISIFSLVLGKFLAVFILYTGILLLTATFSVFVFASGNPELAPILTGYLGLLLLGAVFLAIGCFASALTENQIIAAVITFSSILLIWVVSWVGEGAGVWSRILTYLSFFSHYQNMLKGVIDTQDLIYYLSFTGLGLYLTYSVFEFRKWR